VRTRLACNGGNHAEHAVGVDGGIDRRYGAHCGPSVHS
jgi:hypothetical protein